MRDNKMRNLTKTNNPYGDDKDFSGCSLFGMMNLEGNMFSSDKIVKAIANMHDRGNGQGGGFAVYGIYPDFKDYYAFHIMYLSKHAKEKTDKIKNRDNKTKIPCELFGFIAASGFKKDTGIRFFLST